MDITNVGHLPTQSRPGRKPTHSWHDVATACDAAPSDWHLVLTGQTSAGLASKINHGRNATLPNTLYQAATRSHLDPATGNRLHDVYVRRLPKDA